MATGLEVRAPFLDREVVEGCLRLPAPWKVDATHEKLLLREGFGHLLPPEVLARPKQGFGSPMARWLADPAVTDLIHAELVDPSAPVFDLLDHRGVQPFLAANDQRTWTLLTVAMWWRHHRPAVSGSRAGAVDKAGS
jgi:asparagine synthase (glutamine-hydrolysing)